MTTGVAQMSRRALLLCSVVLCSEVLWGCTRPYQVGDHVLVEWGEDRLLYPAFITEVRDRSRYRIHYEGYPARWDETVDLTRIKGRVTGKVIPPPPPLKVRLARGINDQEGSQAPVSQFKEGDRIRVKWRNSVYRASVLEVVSATEIRVRYEAHESAWDEVVPVSRIVD